MATTEIDGENGLPRDNITISDKIQQVLYGVGHQDANKSIKTHYAHRYAHIVIVHVSKEEENAEGQKKNMTTGTIKVYGLSHKR